MDLVILQREYKNLRQEYRGLRRPGPPYLDDLPRDSELNKAFYWYVHATSGFEGIHDLERAREIVSLYHQHTPDVVLEILEITKDRAIGADSGGYLLGYDAAERGFGLSIIERCLPIWTSPDLYENLTINPDDKISPLDELWVKYFIGRLNKHLLFPDYDTASFCLSCLRRIHEFIPNYCESDKAIEDMEVVGLWSVSSTT